MTKKMTTPDHAQAAQQRKQGSSVQVLDTGATPQGGDKVCPEGVEDPQTCTTPDEPALPTLPVDAAA